MDEFSNKSNNSITLDTRFEFKGDCIFIDYQILNYSSKNIFVFNKLFNVITKENVFLTDVNFYNVELAYNRCFISKKIFNVPDNLLVENLLIPCASIVKSGNALSEIFSVKLPIYEDNPYENYNNRKFVKIECDSISFELGYFLSNPENEELQKRSRVNTSTGESFHFSSFNQEQQELIHSF